MKYRIRVKSQPSRSMDDQAIISLRAAAQAALPSATVYRASVEDPEEEAFIDSQTLLDEIACGNIDASDFISYCEAFKLPAYDEHQDIVPTSAQRFLISLWGQGVFGVTLPLDEAAARIAYAGLVDFAKARDLQLLPLMPVGVDRIDLTEPGTLPPGWHDW